MIYQECLERLYTANLKGMKLGLGNMQKMCQLLGNPERRFKSVHVAGTNGKGSCVQKVAATLAADGYRVGLFTSPHISSFRERIRMNGMMIPEEDVRQSLQEIFSLADDAGLFLTFFEYTTALMLHYFAKVGVDYAVLETGLGGRLDATNICQPILTVITSIGLDHTQILGETLEEIAAEKSGILKARVPSVIGPKAHYTSIVEEAQRLNCPLHFVPDGAKNFEEENRAIARRSLELLGVQQASIEQGISALPPCRFEQVKQHLLKLRFGGKVPKGVILDVAHNPQGLSELVKRIEEPACFLCGFSRDKDVASCLEVIKNKASKIFFVQAESPRAMPVCELVALGIGGEACPSIPLGLQAAFDYAHSVGQILVVCGTFFIMSEVRQFLGFDEARDPCDLNEKASTNVTTR